MKMVVFSSQSSSELTQNVNSWLSRQESIHIIERQVAIGAPGATDFSAPLNIVIWYEDKEAEA